MKVGGASPTPDLRSNFRRPSPCVHQSIRAPSEAAPPATQRKAGCAAAGTGGRRCHRPAPGGGGAGAAAAAAAGHPAVAAAAAAAAAAAWARRHPWAGRARAWARPAGAPRPAGAAPAGRARAPWRASASAPPGGRAPAAGAAGGQASAPAGRQAPAAGAAAGAAAGRVPGLALCVRGGRVFRAGVGGWDYWVLGFVRARCECADGRWPASPCFPHPTQKENVTPPRAPHPTHPPAATASRANRNAARMALMRMVVWVEEVRGGERGRPVGRLRVCKEKWTCEAE